MVTDLTQPEFFRKLQNEYVSRTGYNLVLSDLNGSIQMGLPDCDKFPCMKSCRECRERIFSESLRTGKVCLDACHEGYVIWGLPYAVEDQPVGGLVVIGGVHNDSSDEKAFSDACQELYRMMDEMGILPDFSHSEALPLEKGHRFVRRQTFIDLSERMEAAAGPMVQCLATAEFDLARLHFNEIVIALREFSELPIDLVRGLGGELIFTARRQFVDAGMDPYSCYSESGLLLEQVSEIDGVEDLISVLEDFLKRFILLSQKAPKNPDALLIDKALTHIEEHLRENLTRESVARSVGISPSHFSRLIREKKGRTFTDLLNQYRIERASKLLVRSPRTLAEIASDCGFCDQSYFSKVFRRYKQMSPAKYRSSQQK